MLNTERAVRIDPSRARAATASVMAKAQHEIPSFHLTREVPCADVVRSANLTGISVTAAMLPPVAQWLGAFGALNGRYIEGRFEPSRTVNLGLAVAHRENVLIVVTLEDCASWTPSDFGAALSAIREKNRENAFSAADFVRPTFTISNLGGFGVDEFTSIITPPQVAVLSVGAVRRVPVVRGEEMVPEQIVSMTLGLDHRAVDGAYGARALAALTALFASPLDSRTEEPVL
jgi:pyruvate dehydrogenase E2 component (dihydrolipoamide acetyltransferase)